METIKTPNLIIGFGKAGKTLAADLARHGERVVLAEESTRMYGGTCINIGCIPSKKLIVEGQQGSRTADKEAVFSQAMQAKETLTTKLREANYHKVADLTGVDVINATAEFVDVHTVKLTGADGEKLVEADRIFINTGASPRRLNIEGADGNRIYDSTAMLSLPQRPTRLVIVGGGYISLEFACMYQAFGSHVTILETSDTFLAREDRDVAEEMLRVLTGKGIDVCLGARTERFVEGPEHTAVVTTVGTSRPMPCLWASAGNPTRLGCILSGPAWKWMHADLSSPTTGYTPHPTSGPWATWQGVRSLPTSRSTTTAS